MKTKQVQEYATVKKWGQRIKLGTPYLTNLGLFISWYSERNGETTPDDLIKIQLGLSNSEQYKLLDEIQLWVSSHKGRAGTKKTKYSQIKSFFSHNRAELPRDPGFKTRSSVPPVNGGMSADEIKQILLSSNILYRALFLCMFQGALDGEMFHYWNENGWLNLREQLISGNNPIKIELPGRKRNRNITPYYTFISGDAIKALRTYLPDPLPLDRPFIFINQHGGGVGKQTLREYFNRHLKKLCLISVITPNNPNIDVRYGKNPHEMRDTFRTLWSMSPARYEVGEYFMGHTVDKLGYDKLSRDPDFYKREYVKASRFLNLLSSNAPYGLVESDEVDQLRTQLIEAKQGQNDEVKDLKAEMERMKQQQEETLTLLKRLTEKEKPLS
jgi:hypothetical protein